jgi:cyanophycinase
MNGTLALVGSGEYLPPMESVDKFLLNCLSGPARVVCLPTAAGTEGEERLGYWSRLGVEHFTRLGAEASTLRVIDRASAREAGNAEKIRAANFVYLSGGDPGYLHKTLTGTPVWEAILLVLENGGVVAGCSAGAMIFGEKIPSFPMVVPLRPVFKLIPGAVIVPHYDEFGAQWGPIIKAMLGQLTLLGVEGNTALVKLNGTHTAVGAGGVTVWSKKQKTRFTNGQEVKWP